jgi:ABC-type nickel/cobalt efflux system permease component RcnA
MCDIPRAVSLRHGGCWVWKSGRGEDERGLAESRTEHDASLWASHTGASQARNMHERPQNSACERAHRSGLEQHFTVPALLLAL